MSMKLVCDQCNVEIPISSKRHLHIEAHGQDRTNYDYCENCAILIMAALTVKRRTEKQPLPIQLPSKNTHKSMVDWLREVCLKPLTIKLLHMPDTMIDAFNLTSNADIEVKNLANQFFNVAKNHAAGLIGSQNYAVMVGGEAYYFCLVGQVQ